MSCQISFYPLKTDKVNERVKEALAVIKKYPLQSETNALSTVVIGEKNKIFEMLDELYETMTHKGVEFSMALTLSNSCGCDLIQQS